VEESLAGAWLAAAAEAAPGAWQEFAVRGTAEVETALGAYSAG
jgi:hypothetical protein